MDPYIISKEIADANNLLGPNLLAVGIFGSGVSEQSSSYYIQAHELAFQLSAQGISVITGGGEGIMEAANKGALKGNGDSIGLCLSLPQYERKNKFISPGKGLFFSSLFSRKAVFLKYIKSAVFFPGGIGTLDEVFEVLLAIRTQKIPPFPLYFIGKDFWTNLFLWLDRDVIQRNMAPKEFLDLIKITDNHQEAMEGIFEYLK